MNNNIIEDYNEIIKNNQYIESMYKRLATLDYLNEKNNEEYKYIIELIKDLANKNEMIYLKYPLHDEKLLKYVQMCIDVDLNDQNDLQILSDKKSITMKRFYEFFYHYSLNDKNFRENDLDSEIDDININVNGCTTTLYDIKNLFYNYGLDDFFEMIQKIKNDVFNKIKESQIIKNKKSLINLNLQESTILDYIDKEIDSTNKKNLKRKLINAKYLFIGSYKVLEDAFLQNQQNYSQSEKYQKEFAKIYNENDAILRVLKNYYVSEVGRIAKLIIERKKDKYNNINEEFNDITTIILMKSYTSLITDYKTIFEIFNIENELLEKNDNEFTKKLIKESRDLDCNLIITRNL